MSSTPPEKNKKKIHRALKSLFRYSKFKKDESPDILIDGETKILTQSLADLTVDDIYYVVENWTDFYIEESKETAIDNIALHQGIEQSQNTDKLFN